MEVGPETWGGRRHTRSNSSIQPPWECDLSAPVGSTVVGTLDASPSHSSTSNAGGYGGSYLDSSSLPPSPLETLYRRTASFSRSPSPSVAHQETVSSHHHHVRSFSVSGIPSDGSRRRSLSGPLPASEESPSAYTRRPSLSGPLPFPSENPYSSFDDELLRSPSPWSEHHLKTASPSGGTNPYLNPHIFSPKGSLSVSSNTSLSPSSLPRSPPPPHSSVNDSGLIADPNNVGYSGVDVSLRGAPHVRQLYGYNAGTDPFASLVSSSVSCSPPSPSNECQWASVPVNLSSRTVYGKPALSGLSQRTHQAPPSSTGRPTGAAIGWGPGGAGSVGRLGSPNLSRSRSAHNGVNGGTLPFNTRGALNRSLSCSGAEEIERKYSKGGGGLGDGVLETLVAQLVFAQEKPRMLADIIFCPSKISSTRRDSKGPYAYARDLVERILRAQVHALTPFFKDMAQKLGEFQEEIWSLTALKNGKVEERFPNEGYRLLRLQTQFVEAGLETFDMICRVRKQFPSLMADEGGANAGLLRIACFGGGPGCEALAIRLFFIRLLPALQLQVDIFDRRERWKDIVENISLKGVGLLTVDLFDVVFHPTWLRSYRLLVFIDSLGEEAKTWRSHNWSEFWSNLFRNTSPGVVVIIQESTCPWEDMKPKNGSNWWCSALAEQELVHVVRKI